MICSECGLVVGDRVIDVGSEWRTFSNEKSGVDPSRVGGPENPLLSGGDLSTMIGPGTGPASFDSFGGENSFPDCSLASSNAQLFTRLFRSCQIPEPSYNEQLRPGTHLSVQGDLDDGRSHQSTKDDCGQSEQPL